MVLKIGKLTAAITALISCLLLISITFPEMLAIIYGAIISAFIGVIGVYFTGRIREQEWRKENVYKPLYNEVSNVVTFRETIFA